MTNAAETNPAGYRNKQTHISVQRYFEISLLLMVASSFLTLASTGKVDAVSIVLFLVALGVKLWSYARGESGFLLQPATVTHLAVGCLIFLLLDFAVLNGGAAPLDRILPVTVHLILFITVIKIFSARRYRDYGYLAALSFLMMLAGAVLTVSTSYLVGLTFYVLCAIAMFISYDIKRGIEASDEAPRGPYASLGRNRVAIEHSLLLTALCAAGGVAALGAVLFFVIPRFHTAYFSSLAFQTQNVTGFSESVRLGEMGKIARSNLVVMRVKVQGNPSRFSGIHWRGIALTSFTGRTWYNENTAGRMIAPLWPGHFLLPPAPAWHRRPVRLLRYEVLLSSVSTDVLFVAAQPREIAARIPAISLDETRSLHNPQHAYVPIEYSVVSDAGLPSPHALRNAASHEPKRIKRIYLELPKLDPRIAALAQNITRQSRDNYDRVLAIQQYLERNFTYTLSNPAIEPAEPVANFLFVTKKGYCAYFAAAMAVMLRTLDIPARIVNGFHTGTYNRLGGDFIVRARDAHSWVEVYFPGYGWIPFDPTPGDSGEVAGAGWGRLSDYLDAASLFWNEWVINYDFAHQAVLAQKADRDSRHLRIDARSWFATFRQHGVGWAGEAARAASVHPLPVLALLLIAIGSALLFFHRSPLAEFRLRWNLRFRRSGRPLGPREATMTYQQWLKGVRNKGFDRHPSETPREFARSLPDPELRAWATEFTSVYNGLRFGGECISCSRLRQLLKNPG
ncbi:MAG: transglutaminase TgpA family protein [Terriglobia bacterium]